MFLWRSLQPDALTLLLRFLAMRDRGAATPVREPSAEGGLARPGQDDPPKGAGR